MNWEAVGGMAFETLRTHKGLKRSFLVPFPTNCASWGAFERERRVLADIWHRYIAGLRGQPTPVTNE